MFFCRLPFPLSLSLFLSFYLSHIPSLCMYSGTATSPTRRTDSATTTSTATAAAGTAGSADAVPGAESPARPAGHGSGPAGADA